MSEVNKKCEACGKSIVKEKDLFKLCNRCFQICKYVLLAEDQINGFLEKTRWKKSYIELSWRFKDEKVSTKRKVI